ncbi:MAG: hypothetical protein WCK18_19565 [Prolixibacteraceae bacterium]
MRLEVDAKLKLLNDDYGSSFKILHDEIDNNRPFVYSSYYGDNCNNLIKNFKIFYDNNYEIQKVTSSNGIGFITQLIIKNDAEFIDIKEGHSEINFIDKYQLICKFKWNEPLPKHDVCIQFGFTNSLNERHYIKFSDNGFIRFYKSNLLEIEKEIDKTILHEKKYNRITIQKYDNKIEVIVNLITVFTIYNKESYKSSFLCFYGKQNLFLDEFSITSLTRTDFKSDIVNKENFSFTKNYSIISLIQNIRKKQKGSNLMFYFQIIANFIKQSYFNTYTQNIIAPNYQCNSTKLIDIFIEEFYLARYHLMNPDWELSKISFYCAFDYLSTDARTKVNELAVGSKTQALENFILNTAEKRINTPHDAFDLAGALKDEATYFLNWLLEFGSGILRTRSISDKVANEIVECAITYYNSINPPKIDFTRQTLKLLTWASDFAFNQQLRDRINKNIAIILKENVMTDYTIIDFDLKDRTRNYLPFKPKIAPVEVNSNIKSFQENGAEKVKIEKSSDRELNKDKKKSTPNRTIENLLDKFHKARHLLDIFVSFAIKHFIIILISGVVLYAIFTHKSEKPSKWAGNTLENGTSPYDSYFGKGIYDYNSKCWTKFKNGNSTDVIVCLENVYTGTTIRNEYIRVGSDYTMSYLPVGVYKIKVFYGKDWNPEKSLKNGSIRGAFDSSSNFSVSDNPKDLVNISIATTNEGISYSTYEITLYTVSNGNMKQRNINSEDFFK